MRKDKIAFFKQFFFFSKCSPKLYFGKHCEKRQNCLFQAIFLFLTMFSKAIYLQCVKMGHCVVIGYGSYQERIRVLQNGKHVIFRFELYRICHELSVEEKKKIIKRVLKIVFLRSPKARSITFFRTNLIKFYHNSQRMSDFFKSHK